MASRSIQRFGFPLRCSTEARIAVSISAVTSRWTRPNETLILAHPYRAGARHGRRRSKAKTECQGFRQTSGSLRTDSFPCALTRMRAALEKAAFAAFFRTRNALRRSCATRGPVIFESRNFDATSNRAPARKPPSTPRHRTMFVTWVEPNDNEQSRRRLRRRLGIRSRLAPNLDPAKDRIGKRAVGAFSRRFRSRPLQRSRRGKSLRERLLALANRTGQTPHSKVRTREASTLFLP